MRDEDLKNLPQSIERWRFAELMHALGFGEGFQDNLRDLEVDYTGIHAVVYATDAEGRKYLAERPEAIPVQDLGEKEPTFVTGSSGREAVTHEISIPFVGRWEKPADPGEEVRMAERVERTAIHLWQLSCELYAEEHGEETPDEDWPTAWLDLLAESEREKYRGKARRMLVGDAWEFVPLCGATIDVPDRGSSCTLEAGHEGVHWSPLTP